jgi:hypothetical protein
MFSKAIITTSLLAALVLPTSLVSAAPLGAPNDLVKREPIFGLVKNLFRGGRRSFIDDEALTLDTRRNPLGIDFDRFKVTAPRPGTPSRPRPTRRPRGRNGKPSRPTKFTPQNTKRDLLEVLAADLEARSLGGDDDELFEREPIFGLVKGLFRGGRRDLGGFEEVEEREWMGDLDELD